MIVVAKHTASAARPLLLLGFRCTHSVRKNQLPVMLQITAGGVIKAHSPYAKLFPFDPEST